MKTFKEIEAEISNLKRDAVEAVKREHPTGTYVLYYHGKNPIEAKVIRHSQYHPTLWVEGATGKRYWIDANRCA